MSYLENFNPERIDSIPEIKQQFRFIRKAIDEGELGDGGDYPPEGGVPKSDLSEEVQTSLNKADSALQEAGVKTINSQSIVGDGNIEIPGLSDKEYNPEIFSGLGKKYLNKNIQTIDNVEKNVLTQDMLYKNGTNNTRVPNTDTIFVIQYDYDLNGGSIAIPENCVLLFEGGSLRNGTITFDYTTISSESKCFGDSLTFAGTILNGEVFISWFVSPDDTMQAIRDFSYDCHDVIISAMKLTYLIRGNVIHQGRGWLNLQKIPLAVLQPIVIDGGWGAIGIRKANISFVSTQDGQALFLYSSSSGSYTAIEDSAFQYRGSADGNWHEKVSCIQFDNWRPTVYCYWRDIEAWYFTGYFMVNKVYMQEVTFENITLYSSGGFITYNAEKYYGNTMGSSNIVHFLNININASGMESRPEYVAKCTVPYLWSFHNYMEITLKNIVSQGVGIQGQEALWLAGGSYSQTCILDGFWVEFTSGNVDRRAKISGSCNLHLYKQNISGFYTIGNDENVNIYCHGAQYQFYNNSSFIDNSDINEDTKSVSINLEGTLYSDRCTLSDKFKDWLDKGIINLVSLKPEAWNQNKMPSINVVTSESFDAKQVFISSLLTMKRKGSAPAYLSEYKKIPLFVCKQEDSEDDALTFSLGFDISANKFNTSGEFVEIIYRATSLVNVTEENKSSVYVKDGLVSNASNVYLYKPEVGTTEGTSTGWLRKSIIRNSSLGCTLYYSIKNCKIEIAYLSIKGQSAIRDYGDICYDADNEDIDRKPYPPTPVYLLETEGKTFDNIMSVVDDCTCPIHIDGNVIQKDSNGAIHTSYPVRDTTTNRPTVLTSVDEGFEYYDTTLQKYIMWNGTSWANLDGSTLS